MDERWPFAGRKKRKVWRGLTVERASRRIVAWGLGSRGPATWQRLWQALPRRYRHYAHYFIGAWRAGSQVLPAGAHVVGKTGPRVVEARDGKLRHHCGGLVRRSHSFSKCRSDHHNRIKIAIDQHDSEITLE